jgi:hypothetical protein
VWLPEGASTVVLSFAPQTVRWGWFALAAGLLVLGALFFAAWRTNRHKPSLVQ